MQQKTYGQKLPGIGLNISFLANVYFPNTIFLDDLEVGVLLVNLLENTMDAYKFSAEQDKQIILSINTPWTVCTGTLHSGHLKK